MKSLDEIKARCDTPITRDNLPNIVGYARQDIPRLCEVVEYLMRRHVNQLPDDYRVMIKEVDRILGGGR